MSEKMNGYSKIGHVFSSDLPSKPQTPFSRTSAIQQNPGFTSFESEQPALRRSRSSASQRFDGRGHAAGLQAAVKRAFSIKRSSSIGNGYWRIHDGGERILAEEEDEQKQTLGIKKGSAKKGFFRFCKTFVGL